MSIPKNLINFIGGVIVIVIVAAGIALIALPLYLQSQTTDQTRAQVAGQNGVYQQQIDGLNAAKSNIDEITADVDALTLKVPVANEFDTVFELVGRAAGNAGVKVSSVAADAPIAFSVRTGPTLPGDVPAAAPADDASTDGATTDGTATDGATTDGATAPEPTQPAAPAASGRQQVPFHISVEAPNAAAATRFLDALRSGPRALAIIQSTLAESTDALSLTVEALAFVGTKG